MGSSIGEVHAAILKAFRCEGVITNGPSATCLGSAGCSFRCSPAAPPSRTPTRTWWTMDEPVEIFGLQVHSGDLLYADCHGVISIPHEIADRIPCRAAEIRPKSSESSISASRRILPGKTSGSHQKSLMRIPMQTIVSRPAGLFLIASGALLFSSCSRNPAAVQASAPDTAGAPTVAVAKVKTEDLSHARLTAEFKPYQEVDVMAKVAGYIKEINVDVGDRVKQGATPGDPGNPRNGGRPEPGQGRGGAQPGGGHARQDEISARGVRARHRASVVSAALGRGRRRSRAWSRSRRSTTPTARIWSPKRRSPPPSPRWPRPRSRCTSTPPKCRRCRP